MKIILYILEKIYKKILLSFFSSWTNCFLQKRISPKVTPPIYFHKTTAYTWNTITRLNRASIQQLFFYFVANIGFSFFLMAHQPSSVIQSQSHHCRKTAVVLFN